VTAEAADKAGGRDEGQIEAREMAKEARAVGSLRLLASCQGIVGGLGVVAAVALAAIDFGDPMVRGIAITLFAANVIFVASGICMMWRRFRMLSLIAAVVTCLVFPSGTFLGIWTIIVLNGAGVKELYWGEIRDPRLETRNQKPE
jgi:hypothetical protein